IMKQARARGFQGQFLGASGMADPKLAELAGPAAVGLITIQPMQLKSEAPIVKRFVEGYKAKYGDKNIATYAAYGYDATRLLADAIRRAGSRSRDDVMKALGSTQDFQAVTGTYTFNGKGD